jgi:hypothetical protein
VRDVILDPEHGHERLGTTLPMPFGAAAPGVEVVIVGRVDCVDVGDCG